MPKHPYTRVNLSQFPVYQKEPTEKPTGNPTKCVLCPEDPSKGGEAVMRVNPTGEAPVWACRGCYEEVERLWIDGKILPGGIIRI